MQDNEDLILSVVSILHEIERLVSYNHRRNKKRDRL